MATNAKYPMSDSHHMVDGLPLPHLMRALRAGWGNFLGTLNVSYRTSTLPSVWNL